MRAAVVALRVDRDEHHLHVGGRRAERRARLRQRGQRRRADGRRNCVKPNDSSTTLPR